MCLLVYHRAAVRAHLPVVLGITAIHQPVVVTNLRLDTLRTADHADIRIVAGNGVRSTDG